MVPMTTPLLFQPITFRSVTARNRIAISPMCQYSAEDGVGTDWHIQNLGAKAMGGPGFVFVEATHVSAPGRITLGCMGLWNETQRDFLRRLVALIEYGGGVPGIQIPIALGASSNLPVGLELDGPAGSDRRLLAIGMSMDKIFGRLPPPAAH